MSEAVEESVLVSVTVLLADRVSLVVAVSVFVSVVALVSVRVSEAVEVSVTGKGWSVPPALAVLNMRKWEHHGYGLLLVRSHLKWPVAPSQFSLKVENVSHPKKPSAVGRSGTSQYHE